MLVTAGALRVLNVQPALGRSISRDDDQPGAAETAILSDGYWRRRFGGDPSVIGRAITVDGTPREVIGVMPARFTLRGLPHGFDFAHAPQHGPRLARDFCCIGLARLKPGITVAEANADIDRMLPVYLERYMRPERLPERTRSSSERPCALSKKTSWATWAKSCGSCSEASVFFC